MFLRKYVSPTLFMSVQSYEVKKKNIWMTENLTMRIFLLIIFCRGILLLRGSGLQTRIVSQLKDSGLTCTEQLVISPWCQGD